jgi:hypothetical protein
MTRDECLKEESHHIAIGFKYIIKPMFPVMQVHGNQYLHSARSPSSISSCEVVAKPFIAAHQTLDKGRSC